MKKYIIIFLLVLIPLVVMSRAFDINQLKLNKILPNMKLTDRTWRLNQVLEEEYSGSAWENNSKNIYVYNNVLTTRLDSIFYSQWNSDSQEWITFMKSGFTYDITNEYVTSAMAYVNFGTGYNPYVHYTFTYDNQHRVTSQRIYFYNFDTSEWFLFMRFELFYVSNSNYTVHSYMAGDDEDPEQWTRMSFTWDTQGRIITETDMTSPDSLTWSNDYRYTTTYHPNDTSTGDSFVSDLAHTMWTQQIENYDYLNGSMFGMVSQEIEEHWENNAWVNDSKDTYAYSTGNNLIQRNNFSWDSGQSVWNNGERILYGYDGNNNMTMAVVAYWDGFANNYMDHKRFVLSWGQDTANDDNTTPEYSGLNLSVSPNPFNSEISIRVDSKSLQPVKMFVYNSKGQLVRTIDAQPNSTVTWDGKDTDSNNVSNGIYFLKAVGAETSKTIKILKLK